jgi:hypothetical protein
MIKSILIAVVVTFCFCWFLNSQLTKSMEGLYNVPLNNIIITD